MSRDRCTVTLVLDFDSLFCVLHSGHPGLHMGEGDGGRFHWIEQVTQAKDARG
jgi:hypothetical protein